MIALLRRFFMRRTSQEREPLELSNETTITPEERERFEREKNELRQQYHEQLNRLNVLKWKAELQSRRIPIPGESDHSKEKE